ncbi:hypothetical protein CKM354_000303800 [Cercospora kikuchii]|uniref:Zinc finger PHD-type domain-containing protein n=1 Tax=Cercospora kikuchii TaxID=84275 RepID=A0A9P3FA67_9PEZI|nr:uncharacterized protein CKM354_000303800 [Cercospora kikuchii]GIZ39663.1 hypothetical protein CKM354_000303800 [Cercospora kikuchii]
MPRYKRTADAAQLDAVAEPPMAAATNETLIKLRNMWEFASLMQYIFLFGSAVRIDDDFDIEDLEHECLQPTPSDKLAHIGLQLLKYVSSHRGLTPEIFDEYTRRQYVAKAPNRNPFGDDEEPAKFNDMDICTRIKVLHQLSVWTLGNADRMRSLMPQDEDHLNWRIEPLGWDKEDRSYYVLDDNRLYRRADEPLPQPTPKPKAKPKASAKNKRKTPTRGTRASKRRKVEESEEEELEDQPEADESAMDITNVTNGAEATQLDVEEPGYGFTSKTWSLVAITLEEYQDFMASIFRSRDPNEKQLRARLEDDVLPIIEKRAEALKAKQMKRIRELENLQKMATAKRSSRLADKADKEAEARKEREAQEQRERELKMARAEQERQKRIEEGHESRRLTREQRVREREAKRILHEEELARLEAEGERAESQGVEAETVDGDGKRASGRQRQTQRDQHKKELERLAEEEGNWYFDCSVCGQHGENMDDGTHSVSCERCNVWEHSACHGYTPKQAEQQAFIFICGTCKRKEEDAKKPKIPPLKLHNHSSDSPEAQKVNIRPPTANGQKPPAQQSPGAQTNGQYRSPQAMPQLPQGHGYPAVGNFASRFNDTAAPSRPYAAPTVQNGQPSHYQQHQSVHHNAVSHAGGHPQSAQFHPPPPHHYQQPQAQYNHYQYPQNHQPWQQYQQQGPPPQAQYRPGSSQMNGFQSPSKADAKPLYPPAASQGQQHYHQQQPQQQQYQAQAQPSHHHQQTQSSPRPPQQSPPQLAPRQLQTPLMHHPQSNAGGSPHANQVAADGMNGPWPKGSSQIPQKHAQSPAPPPSESKVLPPLTPLAPSPGQATATNNNIPVKKLQLSPAAPSAVTLPPIASMEPAQPARPPQSVQAAPGAGPDRQDQQK